MLRFWLLAAIPAACWGQTMVEYGLGVAAAGTAGAGAAGSRGIAGIFSNLTKTLNSATEGGAAAATAQPAKAATAKVANAAGAAQPVVTEAAAPAPPPKPVVVYEDPAGIKTGMEQAELLKRFGEPTAKITTGSDAESLTYYAKDRVIEVEMRAGKVYSVQPKSKPRQAGVVLLQ
jgi:hypothetical protein